jgi:hypothetical protein
MGLHLALGLDHEAQAPAVTGPGRQAAQGKGSGVPERIEPAAVRAQLVQASCGPGQVIDLVLGGLPQMVALSGVPVPSAWAS